MPRKTYPLTIRRGREPNAQGVYICPPDLISTWLFGADHAQAKLLELDGGQWLFGIDYLVKGAGQADPLVYTRPAWSHEMARDLCHYLAQDVVRDSEARGLKGQALQSLQDWANQLSDPEQWMTVVRLERLDVASPSEAESDADAAGHSLPAPLPPVGKADYQAAENAAQDGQLDVSASISEGAVNSSGVMDKDSSRIQIKVNTAGSWANLIHCDATRFAAAKAACAGLAEAHLGLIRFKALDEAGDVIEQYDDYVRGSGPRWYKPETRPVGRAV